jgi:gliding motility-associated-like protein
MKKIVLFFTIYFCSFFCYSQIIVDNVTSGLQLAQKLLGNGVSISNVTYNGSFLASGIFKRINAPVAIDSGILLTTGRASTRGAIIGVDGLVGQKADNNNLLLGDADLNAIVSPLTTFDATILEFDFVPLGDTVSFNYVFSSEEYPTFVCSQFNDIFGFFISGPGIVGKKNMALVPGTNVPVSINTINSGMPGSMMDGTSCTLTNTALYINNNAGMWLTHNGLTKKLQAFSRVTPCQTYHLKIIISDVEDGTIDSGVFIEANSLNANTPTIKALGNIDNTTGKYYIAEGCLGSSLKFNIAQTSTLPSTVNIEVQGTATNGVDASLIPSSITIPANANSFTLPISATADALTEGTEILKIFIKSNCANNAYSDSAILEIREYEPLYILPDTSFICKGSSVQLLGSTGYTTYTWNANATLSNTNIFNPFATPTADSSTYYCVATLGTCKALDSAKVFFNTAFVKTITPVLCSGINSGAINLGLSTGWVAPVNFILNGVSQLDSNFNNLASGNYTLTIIDNVNCQKTIQVNVPQAFPNLVINEVVTPSVCNTVGNIKIVGSGGLAPYLYSVNANPYIATNDFPIVFNGNFVLAIKDANNCITTKNITIANPQSLTISTSFTNATCSIVPDGTITVNATGGTLPYQYSSDGGTTFQSSNVLIVSNGTISVNVKDANGCVGSQIVVVPINNTITINTSAAPAICEGTSKTLNATSNADTYIWTPNTNIINATSLTPTVNPPTTTKYYLKATKGVCTKTDSILINVLAAPTVIASNDTSICYNDTITLNANGGTTYIWQPNYNINNLTIKTPKVSPLVTSTYWVNTTDALGCKSLLADSVKINVIPKINVNAGNDTSIVFGQPYLFNVLSNGSFFSWQPTSFLNNAALKNPSLNLPGNGDFIYYVKAFTAEGCFALDTIKFTVFPFTALFVPTVFTPNGDGLNDLLKIKTIGIKELRFFKIYNRWGQLVFETRNANMGWNGLLKNKTQGNNTFAWTAEGIDYSNKTIRKNGTVTIVH